MEQQIITPSEAKAQGLKRYFTGKPCKHGHVADRFVLTGNCTRCAAENSARLAKANPEKGAANTARYRARHPERAKASRQKYVEENRDKLYEIQRRCDLRHYEKYLWNSARARARTLGRDFDIEVSDIVVPDTCPVLGIPLIRIPPKEQRDHSPTLDRVDQHKGYVKGNVKVISWRANRLKSSLTLEELLAIAAYVKANLPPS